MPPNEPKSLIANTLATANVDTAKFPQQLPADSFTFGKQIPEASQTDGIERTADDLEDTHKKAPVDDANVETFGKKEQAERADRPQEDEG